MEILKWVHIACALLSFGGFFARGVLMIKSSLLLQARAVKVVPHVVDTVLLLSALILASQWGWAALTLPWILVKLAALLIYIGLGVLALHAGRTKTLRVSAWVAAMMVFGYIVAVAITKNPLLVI